MSRGVALLILLACAMLEAGGDALARKGIHAGTTAARIGFFAMAAIVLFAYGWLVNRPPWSFGTLLGIYVVFFFVVAQLISFLAFGQKPSIAVLLGGLLIVSGGLVIGLAAN